VKRWCPIPPYQITLRVISASVTETNTDICCYCVLFSLLYKTSNIAAHKDEAEVLEFSFATPVASGDTIKRAKMKQAETDSYKGRVARVEDEADVSKNLYIYLLNQNPNSLGTG